MTTVFADTFYYLALLNPSDAAHERAEKFSDDYDGNMVTTEWVLTEVPTLWLHRRIGRRLSNC
jgi:predicted nucleic acid-binding protein